MFGFITENIWTIQLVRYKSLSPRRTEHGAFETRMASKINYNILKIEVDIKDKAVDCAKKAINKLFLNKLLKKTAVKAASLFSIIKACHYELYFYIRTQHFLKAASACLFSPLQSATQPPVGPYDRLKTFSSAAWQDGIEINSKDGPITSKHMLQSLFGLQL